MFRSLLVVLLFAGCSSESGGSADVGNRADDGPADAGQTGQTNGSGDLGYSSDSGAPGGEAGGGADAGDGGSTVDLGNTTGNCGQRDGQLLWPDAPWNTPVDTMPLAADSPDVIAYLEANQRTAATFQIDFSLKVMEADVNTMRREFTPNNGHYSPDCDLSAVPVPEGGEIEGESGYACEGDGDCHLIVKDLEECRLYEMWRANIVEPTFDGGCLAVWDMTAAYPETLRGDYCTSADAAGLPIAPLLATADEVAAGEIKHALRFILPNARSREDVYVRPGTHSTNATSGPAEAPPYSGLLRLRSDVDLSALTPAQRTIGQALKTYGMYLADGGNITFTMASDRWTANSWEDVGIGPHDMKWLSWTDFELVDTGGRINWSSGDCERTPIED